MQIQLEEIPQAPYPVTTIEVGKAFIRNNEKDIFMRVKPTSFILNSDLVSDCLNRGKALIVNLRTGTCYFIPGEELVWPVKAILHAQKN